MEYIAIIILIAITITQAIKIISNKPAQKILALPISPDEKIKLALEKHNRATAVYVTREVYKATLKEAVDIVEKIERNQNV